jgi:hypothetical protein
MEFVVHVRRYNDYPPGFGSLVVMLMQKTRNSCPLSIKKQNESLDLVFWSL